MKNVFKLRISNLIGLFVLLLLVSCGKVQDDIELNDYDSEFFNTAPSRSSNDCNEYNYYGESHNEGAEYVMEFKEQILELSEDEFAMKTLIAQKTQAFLNNIQLEGEAFPEDEIINWESFFDLDLTDYVPILEQSDLTAYEKQVMSDYFDQFDGHEIDSEAGLLAFIDFTEALECTLIEDEEIVNDKEVFAALSVARNSAQLWHTYNNDNPGEIYGLLGILGGDIFGALFGASGKKKRRGWRILGFAIAFSITGALSPV